MILFLRIFLIIIFFFFNISIVNSSDKVVFIDIDYVLNNSNLGKEIYNDLDKINNENIKKINLKEKKIKEKKDLITKTKNISSKEKLENDINNFNQEVEAFRLEKEKLLKEFKMLKEKKLANFLKKINPIIQDYMKKNSIEIVLDEKQIFIGLNSNDITNDIITLINDS